LLYKYKVTKKEKVMKNTLASLLVSVAMVGTAVAADLPSKAAPAAPAPAASSVADGFYLGGNLGANYTKFDNLSTNKMPYTIGAVGGYEWNRYFRTEATFDYTSKQTLTTKEKGETVFGNAVVQYPVGFGFTPYALAGVGEGFDAWGNKKGDAHTLYNIGGGVRYAISKNIELDGRYRYVNAFSGVKFENNNVVTFGANYKF
jgi:hypothetical protein